MILVDDFYKTIYYYKKSSMTRSNDLECFILLFYRDSMIVYSGVVYKYESILVILINIFLLINIKFTIK
jgi:hypothetical protein